MPWFGASERALIEYLIKRDTIGNASCITIGVVDSACTNVGISSFEDQYVDVEASNMLVAK
jgi:hypothetical protein